MKRLSLAILFLFLSVLYSHGAHIKGGFFTYKYLGPGAGTNLRYQVTLTVYMICNPSAGQLNNPINFTFFDAGNNQFIQDVSVSISSQYQLSKIYDEPCITGDERGCYYTIVVYDLPSIELPDKPAGYIVSYQRCCRLNGIVNITNSGTVGNTFSIKIPGSATMPGAQTNSSPTFLINDTAVVCNGNSFQLSFQAADPDGDSLSYSFCSAYQGASQGDPAPTTAAPPPYSAVPYQFPYSGIRPLGPGVNINPVTGLISGIAPNTMGQFVVCVCVYEFRNGQLIGSTRKELHISVNDCDPLNAELDPQMVTCDGFTVNFSNKEQNNPPGTEYLWIFGDPASGPLDTSLLPTPTHTYSDTGVYLVKLKVSLPGGICADSTTMEVGVYPGFFPGFTISGSCYTNPFQFTDTTKTNYGMVDSWHWNFGDNTTTDDTAIIQNPQWTYVLPGTKTVELIVTNSKGCIDTVQQAIDVLDKPPLSLSFSDSLICRGDTLQANATGPGNFIWTPPTHIINANSANPLLFPDTSTWYYVNQDDNGCLNRDSLLVRVIGMLTVHAGNDSTICQGDAIQLNASTNGVLFDWTPAANLSDPTILNPVAITNSTTLYTLTSSVGGCSATDQLLITTIPYPVANAGNDPQVCYNSAGQILASITGSSFLWTPTLYMDNPLLLNPVVTAPRTTQYILSAYDTLGCPKPGRDTVTVVVYPKVRANAGRDTTVVAGQPLQLNASGGISYTWSPPTGLSNTGIRNPTAVYHAGIDSVHYKVVVGDAIGCLDSAFVTVYVFKTNPAVFVPTAFTPNNDGLNDVVRPFAVGIKRINYFAIYNRWGEQVYFTNAHMQGWDGTLHGVPQPSNVFVWMVSAVDYLDKPYFQKGSITLIR